MFLFSDLHIIRKIGEGSFGQVYLVCFPGLRTGMERFYALKVSF